jgi:hypothetical protein
MNTDDIESALLEGRRFNERLDARLMQTGVVDRELFFQFADVESDPNASSVGWLNAKLLVLASRLSTGAELSLYEPSKTASVPSKSVAELVAWANHHFPIARFKP